MTRRILTGAVLAALLLQAPLAQTKREGTTCADLTAMTIADVVVSSSVTMRAFRYNAALPERWRA